MKKSTVKIKPCKKVTTFDADKKPKGWLLEVVSDSDKFTEHLKGQVYLTVLKPGFFTDFHLHAQADYFVTCLKGKVVELIYKSRKEKQEVKMGDGDFKTVFLPKGHPHAIKNIGEEPAYVLIYRYPAWNPEIKEQLDIPPKDIETEAAWKKVKELIKKFK
jgi:dTDP-4-dehydrorhamnose 3,5-epimerase-like enzyme